MKKKIKTPFKRFCKTMELRNDKALIENYKKSHAKGAVWPEITIGMKEIGIIAMEIYVLDTKLFMIMDTIVDFDHDKAMSELSKKPRQQEWETYMSQFQHADEKATAERKWRLMECIYTME